MTVGFYTVFRKDPQHYALARILERSIRHYMPDVEVVHFTDENSPAAVGVDRVVRKPHGKMLERRLEHYADCHGDWLLLDTDCVIQRDVRDVFNQQFDVALTDRRWPHVKQDDAFILEQPFNTGVCFSRSANFWRLVLMHWRSFSQADQASWFSEQKAVAKAVRTEQFHVLTLPGMTYNYPPTTDTDEGLTDAAIVHFKGPRKAMMVAS